MRLLNSEGPIKELSRRETGHRKSDDEWVWRKFMRKSQKHAEQLCRNQPDIVEKINESNRIEQEKERLRKEKVEAGEWDWHGESGEWFWTSKDPPKDEDSCCYLPLTAEEKKEVLEAEKRELEAMMEQRKKDKLEEKRKKDKERKEQMAKPIDPLPEQELCHYEKIMESIIEEREEAMARYNFFENLNNTKRDIGLYKEDKQSKKKDEGKKQDEMDK